DITGAIEEAKRGLAAFPGDPRLLVVFEALQNEQSRIARLAERPLVPASPPQPVPEPIEHVEPPPPIPPPPELVSISEPTERFFSRRILWVSTGTIGVLALGALLLRSGREPAAPPAPRQPVPVPVPAPAPAVSSAFSLQGMPAGLQVL